MYIYGNFTSFNTIPLESIYFFPFTFRTISPSISIPTVKLKFGGDCCNNNIINNFSKYIYIYILFYFILFYLLKKNKNKKIKNKKIKNKNK